MGRKSRGLFAGNKLKKSRDEGNYEYWFSGEDYYNTTFKKTEQ